MLVLNFKVEEKFYVTIDGVIVEGIVLESSGKGARIGFSGPRGVATIDREAVHLARLADAKQREANRPA